ALTGVSATSSSDVWAVGLAVRNGLKGALAMHWDGTTWAVVPMPSIPGRSITMYGVTAIAADDAWAVGNTEITHANAATPIAMHWDGSTWAFVAPPHVDGAFLTAVSGTAAGDVWAVGSIETFPYTTVILHWDGASWSVSTSPNPGDSGNSLVAVQAI